MRGDWGGKENAGHIGLTVMLTTVTFMLRTIPCYSCDLSREIA